MPIAHQIMQLELPDSSSCYLNLTRFSSFMDGRAKQDIYHELSSSSFNFETKKLKKLFNIKTGYPGGHRDGKHLVLARPVPASVILHQPWSRAELRMSNIQRTGLTSAESCARYVMRSTHLYSAQYCALQSSGQTQNQSWAVPSLG